MTRRLRVLLLGSMFSMPLLDVSTSKNFLHHLQTLLAHLLVATTISLRRSLGAQYQSRIIKQIYHQCLVRPDPSFLLIQSMSPLLSATSLPPARESSRACSVSTGLQFL
jgi:hypothetical protein